MPATKKATKKTTATSTTAAASAPPSWTLNSVRRTLLGYPAKALYAVGDVVASAQKASANLVDRTFCRSAKKPSRQPAPAKPRADKKAGAKRTARPGAKRPRKA
jgi:hypothetical protein